MGTDQILKPRNRRKTRKLKSRKCDMRTRGSSSLQGHRPSKGPTLTPCRVSHPSQAAFYRGIWRFRVSHRVSHGRSGVAEYREFVTTAKYANHAKGTERLNRRIDFPSPPRFRCPVDDDRWRDVWSLNTRKGLRKAVLTTDKTGFHGWERIRFETAK